MRLAASSTLSTREPNPPIASHHKPLRSVQTVSRVREVEYRQAEARVHWKRKEILRLQAELNGLCERRRAVMTRRGSSVLRERLLLDALMKRALDRNRKLEALNLQAAVLLSDYRDAKSRKDAAGSLRSRKEKEHGLRLARRTEEEAALLFTARALRERAAEEEESCEDS